MAKNKAHALFDLLQLFLISDIAWSLLFMGRVPYSGQTRIRTQYHPVKGATMLLTGANEAGCPLGCARWRDHESEKCDHFFSDLILLWRLVPPVEN